MANQNPAVADQAPTCDAITDYDRAHLAVYTRLLDANRDGASPEDMARAILGLEIQNNNDQIQSILNSHLDRARWMSTRGFQLLANTKTT
ncbi:MAG: hypothetical protein HC888_19885 [Candidatus Competibacteraceae bacterium]|nr:hypothetical protein [Candidatus Competibacteraceae bacterium]